jgi:hypothetical protein
VVLELPLAVSDNAWTAIGTLGGAALGVGALLLSTRWQWIRERSERRRDERLNAYAAFLTAVNNVSHRIGNLAESDYGAPARDAQAAAYAFDTEVTPRSVPSSLSAPTRLSPPQRRFTNRCETSGMR